MRAQPQAEGVTNTILTEAQRAETAYESILGGLDDYERIVTEGGGAVVPGKQKDALVSARRHLQLQMKELFNLGVLNGPDLELMDQMIVDATDPVNVGLDFVGGPGLGARTTASVAQLRKQLKQMIEPKLAQAGRSAAPQEVQSTPAPEPTPQITFQTPEQQSVLRNIRSPKGRVFRLPLKAGAFRLEYPERHNDDNNGGPKYRHPAVKTRRVERNSCPSS